MKKKKKGGGKTHDKIIFNLETLKTPLMILIFLNETHITEMNLFINLLF